MAGKRNQRRAQLVLLLLCLVALAVLLSGRWPGLEEWVYRLEHIFGGSTVLPEGVLEIHFIDVGQGDAVFIVTASQKILVDGGERGDTVLNYLRQKGVKKLDLVVGTHPHSDHLGGLVNVLQEIPVSEVMDPGVVHTSKLFEEYLAIIDEKGIRFTVARAGVARNYEDGLILQVLHPEEPLLSSLNDTSIVLKVTFGQVSFLLTGDAEEAAEKELLDRGYNLRSTVLKVAHHGSATATSPSFIRAVRPEVAVIMVGENNSYGHPEAEVLELLQSHGVEIYRTDRHGTIIVTTNGETVETVTQKEEKAS